MVAEAILGRCPDLYQGRGRLLPDDEASAEIEAARASVTVAVAAAASLGAVEMIG